jgi:hypothetical protein
MTTQVTNEDRLHMIRECWNTYGEIAFPMLTSKDLSEIEDLLINFQCLYES